VLSDSLAFEQRQPELCFEALDLLADGRLTAAHAARGPAEALAFVHCDQAA
jgi:hypothetical protein